jgi:hypothetical protein
MEHIAQVAGDGDFLHRVGDAAVFDPEAAGATRIVASDVVHALTHQLGDEQAGAQLAQHLVEVVARPRQARGQHQVVRAAGVAGGLHAQLARRVGAEK